MNERVVPFEASVHAATDVLLPFYANGTLRGEELAFVKAHLAECEQCRREVDWLKAVFAACAAGPLLQDTTSAVPASPRELVANNTADGSRRGLREHWQGAQSWTRWLIAAQLAAIVVLATLLATDSRDSANYRTLGAASPAAPTRETVAVMFDPAITESELRRIVLGVDGRIVGGPSSTDVFVLEIPPERVGRALAALRAERAVRLAERLGPGTAR